MRSKTMSREATMKWSISPHTLLTQGDGMREAPLLQKLENSQRVLPHTFFTTLSQGGLF